MDLKFHLRILYLYILKTKLQQLRDTFQSYPYFYYQDVIDY